VNSLFGYTRSVIHHLERFSRNWRVGESIKIIDLATGSADIPRAILKWARQRKFDVSIVAVDRHQATVHAAASAGTDPNLSIVQDDVFNMGFAAGDFDYALTSLFLHHLDEERSSRRCGSGSAGKKGELLRRICSGIAVRMRGSSFSPCCPAR